MPAVEEGAGVPERRAVAAPDVLVGVAGVGQEDPLATRLEAVHRVEDHLVHVVVAAQQAAAEELDVARRAHLGPPGRVAHPDHPDALRRRPPGVGLAHRAQQLEVRLVRPAEAAGGVLERRVEQRRVVVLGVEVGVEGGLLVERHRLQEDDVDQVGEAGVGEEPAVEVERLGGRVEAVVEQQQVVVVQPVDHEGGRIAPLVADGLDVRREPVAGRHGRRGSERGAGGDGRASRPWRGGRRRRRRRGAAAWKRRSSWWQGPGSETGRERAAWRAHPSQRRAGRKVPPRARGALPSPAGDVQGLPARLPRRRPARGRPPSAPLGSAGSGRDRGVSRRSTPISRLHRRFMPRRGATWPAPCYFVSWTEPKNRHERRKP